MLNRNIYSPLIVASNNLINECFAQKIYFIFVIVVVFKSAHMHAYSEKNKY